MVGDRRGSVVTELVTVGHGTASQHELLDRLRSVGVSRVVDVRIAPGSRRHPHVARDALAQWLPAAGIGYRWEKRLGGFRTLPPDSPDVALRNESFRAYAAHMRSDDFRSAVDEVLAEAGSARTAVMCSETVWWRCHRRLIADFATLARGVAVGHLVTAGRLDPHAATEGVRLRDDGLLVYDAGTEPLSSSAGAGSDR
jgi:uncharacterized protein (DUF488 family)